MDTVLPSSLDGSVPPNAATNRSLIPMTTVPAPYLISKETNTSSANPPPGKQPYMSPYDNRVVRTGGQQNHAPSEDRLLKNEVAAAKYLATKNRASKECFETVIKKTNGTRRLYCPEIWKKTLER